jgi:hypothetical protein
MFHDLYNDVNYHCLILQFAKEFRGMQTHHILLQTGVLSQGEQKQSTSFRYPVAKCLLKHELGF